MPLLPLVAYLAMWIYLKCFFRGRIQLLFYYWFFFGEALPQWRVVSDLLSTQPWPTTISCVAGPAHVLCSDAGDGLHMFSVFVPGVCFTDFSVVMQGMVPGLQVLDTMTGQWTTVEPIQDALVINVGAMAQVCTHLSSNTFQLEAVQRKSMKPVHDTSVVNIGAMAEVCTHTYVPINTSSEAFAGSGKV